MGVTHKNLDAEIELQSDYVINDGEITILSLCSFKVKQDTTIIYTYTLHTTQPNANKIIYNINDFFALSIPSIVLTDSYLGQVESKVLVDRS